MKNKLNTIYQMMNGNIFYVPLLLLLFISSTVQAVEENYRSELLGLDIVNPMNSPLITSVPNVNGSDVRYEDFQNYILLRINPDISNSDNFIATVNVDIQYTIGISGLVANVNNVNLVVEHNNTPGVIHNDKDAYLFTGGYDVRVTVNSVTFDNAPTSYANLELINHIRVNRLYEFDCQDIPAGLTVNTTLTADNEIEVNWGMVDGAEEYQLEWLHINTYQEALCNFTTGTGNDLEYNFRENATRITTTQTTYNVSNVFEEGYVLFRVRALTIDENNFDFRIYGAWSTPSGDRLVCSHLENELFEVGTPHEDDDLNWQYSASYAEEGKKKEVVTYMDGTLRSHQVVTKINTDEQTIVGETFYDHQGRATVQALPVPVYQNNGVDEEGTIQYYTDFNKETNGDAYKRDYFDKNNIDPMTGECICSQSADPMLDNVLNNNGASHYYSEFNDDKIEHQAYVPDAQGFPFTNVEFTPDNTGRVRRQSGVGVTHRLGSDHETKYYYGKPAQEDLNRLFGSEAGLSSHYKKNMVVDPNGQISVSYMDQQGRTIATALAGDTPRTTDNTENIVSPLPSNNQDSRESMTIDILDNQPVQLGAEPLVSTFHHLVTTEGEHDFNYTLNCPDTESTIFPSEVCLNCTYDLILNVTDECGQSVVSKTESGISADCQGAYTTTNDSDFQDVYLKVGNYAITRILQPNQEALQTNTEECLENADIPTLQDFIEEIPIDESLCEEPDCAALCTEMLGDGATQEAIDMCILDCSFIDKCEIAREMMLADFQPTANTDFDFVDDVNFDNDGTFGVFDTDFNPDNSQLGQYATYEDDGNGNYTATHQYSFLNENNNLGSSCNYRSLAVGNGYNNANGEPFMVTNEEGELVELNDILLEEDGAGNFVYTLEDYINDFDFTWAEAILACHPEFCQLQFCETNQASEQYDYLMQNTDNYDDALALGLIDPLNMSGDSDNDVPIFSPTNEIYDQDPFFDTGAGNSTDMSTYLSNPSNFLILLSLDDNGDGIINDDEAINAWELAVVMSGVCEQPNVDICLATGAGQNYFANAPSCTRDLVWVIFRSIYLHKKAQLYEEIKNGLECSAPGGQISHFPSVSDMLDEQEIYNLGNVDGDSDDPIPTTEDEFDAEACENIIAQCRFNAEMMANSIMERLSACVDPTNTQVRDGLIQVMMATCSYEYPYGASNIPQDAGFNPNPQCYGNGSEPIPTSTYSSFDAVLVGAGITISPECNADLIGFPAAYGHDYTASSQYASIDDCACETIFEANIVDPAEWPDGVNSLEEYFEYINDVEITNFNAILCACEAAAGGTPTTQEEIDAIEWDNEAFIGQFIDARVTCPHCVECEGLETAIAAYSEETLDSEPYNITIETGVNGITFIGENAEANAENLFTMLANHLNNEFNVDLGYVQYNDFVAQCQSVGETDAACDLTDVGQSFVNILNTIIDRGTVTNENCLCQEPYLEEYEDVLAEILNPGYPESGCNDIYVPQVIGDHSITAMVFNEPETPPDCEWTISFFGYEPVPDSYDIANIASSPIINSLQNVRPNPDAPTATNQFIAEVEIYVGTNGIETATILVTSECYDIWECITAPGDLELCSSALLVEFEDDCIETQRNVIVQNATNAYQYYIDSITTQIEQNYIEQCLAKDGMEDFTLSYENNEHHFTLYYYDQAGNLIRTIPPEGVEFISQDKWDDVDNDRDLGTRSVFTEHRMETRYKYNSLNQLTHQTMPDHDNFTTLQVNVGNTGLPFGTSISSAVFFDNANGIIFTEGTVFDNPIFTTSDGGASWVPLSAVWENNGAATDFSFGVVNGSTVTPGGSLHYVDELGVIYSSYDGAATIDFDLTFFVWGNFSGLNEIHFIDNDHGIIVGDNGVVGTTMNDGVNWTPFTNNIPQNIDWNDAHMFIDDMGDISAYIVGSGGSIIRVDDVFGASNVSLTTLGTNDLNSITVCGNVGFIAGDNGTLLKIDDITDPNENWYTLDDPNGGDWVTCTDPNTPGTTANLNDIECIDQATIYAVGDNSVILKSTDGGITWSRITDHGDVGDIFEITFITGEQFILSSSNDGTALGTGITIITDPQQGWSTRYFYDRLGRIVASQNSKQANYDPPRYSYTTYDELGRVVEVGELVSYTEPNDAILNNFNNGQNAPPTPPASPICPIGSAFNANNLRYPDNWSFERIQVTKTHYDRPFNAIIEAEFENGIQQNLRNRVATITFVENHDPCNPDAYDNASHFSYDIHGNVRELVQENTELAHLFQQYKKMDYDYDLISGNVNQVSYQEGQPDQFFHKYEYDADNRITQVMTSPDGVLWDEDARYDYYRHGPLARSEVGDLRVQGCDYAYTIQGWIKGVNGNTLAPNRDIGEDGINPTDPLVPPRDAYSYGLTYFEGDYIAIDGSTGTTGDFMAQIDGSNLGNETPSLFNGNISKMVATISPLSTTPNDNPMIQGSAYHYDQLNRILSSKTFDVSLNGIPNASPNDFYNTNYIYDANGNITNLQRNGRNTAGNSQQMDNLSYEYQEDGSQRIIRNRLLHVTEDPNINANDFTEDIDGHGSFDPKDPATHNYTYDEIGNLIGDRSEQIEEITWRVDGKVQCVIREDGSNLPDLLFKYDASGNRITKAIFNKENGELDGTVTYTHYVRDASGNTMAVYKREQSVYGKAGFYLDDNARLIEHHLYGSSRLGLRNEEIQLATGEFRNNGIDALKEYQIGATRSLDIPLFDANRTNRPLGAKQYELSNHLGNVLVTVSDRKLLDDMGDAFPANDRYTADVTYFSDYYPFGMAMMGRRAAGNYRYGFNGKEDDPSGEWGVQTIQDYGFRLYNPGLARWLSVDLLADYPSQVDKSPYVGFWNNPVYYTDPDGNVVEGPKEAKKSHHLERYNTVIDELLEGSSAFKTIYEELDAASETYHIKIVYGADKKKYLGDSQGAFKQSNNTIYISGSFMAEGINKSTIAEEFTHALQNRRFVKGEADKEKLISEFRITEDNKRKQEIIKQMADIDERVSNYKSDGSHVFMEVEAKVITSYIRHQSFQSGFRNSKLFPPMKPAEVFEPYTSTLFKREGLRITSDEDVKNFFQLQINFRNYYKKNGSEKSYKSGERGIKPTLYNQIVE